MRIFTYYANVPEHQAIDELKLIALWRQRWTAAGWEPFVLSEYHAQKHPLYQEFVERMSKLPSVNPAAYELACFVRWLALAAVQGGWMCDYDVMPYAGPDGFYNWPQLTGADMQNLQIYQSRGCCPSFVYAAVPVCLRLCQEFMTGKVGRRDQNGREHWSDQYAIEDLVIAKAEWIRLYDVVRCYTDEGWQTAPLVHYANAYCGPNQKLPRWKHIPDLRKA